MNTKNIVKMLGKAGYWMILIALNLYMFGLFWSRGNITYITDLTVAYNFIIANLFIAGILLGAPAMSWFIFKEAKD